MFNTIMSIINFKVKLNQGFETGLKSNVTKTWNLFQKKIKINKSVTTF